MSSINLAIKSHEDSAQLVKLRRWVKSMTTIVLVVYIVGAAGLLGWWWYGQVNSRRESSELTKLTTQVNDLSLEEALARRLAVRTQSVADFLAVRRNLAAEIGALEDLAVAVTRVEYDSSKGIANVTVRGTKDEIAGMVDTLTAKYDRVRLESLRWTTDQGWVADIALGRVKT